MTPLHPVPRCLCWCSTTRGSLRVHRRALCMGTCGSIWAMCGHERRRFRCIQSIMPLSQHDSRCSHSCSLSCCSGHVFLLGSWRLHLTLESEEIHVHVMIRQRCSSVTLTLSHLHSILNTLRDFFCLMLIVWNPPCTKVVVHTNQFWVAATQPPFFNAIFLVFSISRMEMYLAYLICLCWFWEIWDKLTQQWFLTIFRSVSLMKRSYNYSSIGSIMPWLSSRSSLLEEWLSPRCRASRWCRVRCWTVTERFGVVSWP